MKWAILLMSLFGMARTAPNEIDGKPAVLEKCVSTIPGFFQGQGLYNAAVAELSRHPHDDALFLEIGAYLGQSTCYMSHLLDSLSVNVAFHVIDFWGSAPKGTIPKHNLLNGMTRAEASLAEWARENHRKSVMQFGKGDFQLTWAHFVQTFGKWDNIASVTRGSSKDVSIVARYSDKSVDFLYLDTAHDNTTITELELWWPKVRPGGQMCGDDYDRIPVKTSVKRYFSSAQVSLPVTKLPLRQWCVNRPMTDQTMASTVSLRDAIIDARSN